MFRAVAFVARLVRALLAFGVLAGFTAGVPWLLVASAGWPLDWIGWPQPGAFPGLSDLATAVTSPWSDQMVLGLLASIGWVLWVQFLRDTALEIVAASAAASAARRGLPRPPAGRRGPIRWVAAVLVGAIVGAVLFDAAHSVTSGIGTSAAAAADAAARKPAVAVVVPKALPAGYVITNSAALSAVTAPTAPITNVSVAATGAGDADVPAWARDAPGGVHPVVEGDNLWDIAEAKLGDPYRWREIYKLNRGHVQANGYALTDPDEIHVGWVLAMPAREAAPPPADPGPTDPAPADPAPDNPGTAEPAPGGGPSTAPSAPPASATPAPSSSPPSTATPNASASSAPAPSAAAPSQSASAAPGVESSAGATTDGADAEPPADDRDDQTGITLPAEGWVSLGLAAAIAAVAALLRLQRRRRARLRFPVPVGTAPQPAPAPPSLAAVDAVGSRHLGSDPADRPVGPAVPAPVGVTADGAEVSLFDLPGPGLALHGDGAESAARAVLAAVLSTGAVESIDTRPVVVTTGYLLTRLLPEGAAAVGLDPDGTAYDGERLIVLADTGAAVTHAEEEMIGRRRLLDTFDADTIADLNARTDHAEMQPPYVLLIEAAGRHAARLRAVAAHRAALDLHPVIVGDPSGLDGFPTVEVTADGSVTGTGDEGETSPVARLSTLGAGHLAAVLGMISDGLARPEAGTDVDDPPAEPAPAAASTEEAAEPVPAQPGDGSALARLRVLGPVTVATDAGPIATGMRSGSYTALALLAAHPAGRTLEQLAATLHPDTDKDIAVKRVRTDITTARRVLRAATGHDEAMFVIYDQTTGRYRLDPDTVAVDLWQMLTAIEHANRAEDDTVALAALRRAAELYGGDFADGHDRAWAVDYATTYRHQILSVYARIAEILEADQPDQAVAALERAAELDPVNEELYQRIMRIHGRQHRPDAVRRTLRRLEERLADLGDAEPSQATRRVAERQLRPAAPMAGGQR
jgi:DNA-binding SARP family transcriptional activator